MATAIAPSTGDTLHLFLAAPAFLVVTAAEVTLFDGGDAGRVLWRKPEVKREPAEADRAAGT